MGLEHGTSGSMALQSTPICFFNETFHLPQSALKVAREIDDKIVYALNNSIPTVSFKGQVDASVKCKELHEEVSYNSSIAYCCQEYRNAGNCSWEQQDQITKPYAGWQNEPDSEVR